MCYWQIAAVGLTTATSMANSYANTKEMMKAHQLNVQQEIMQNNIANANMRMQQIDMAMAAREELSNLDAEELRTLGSLNQSFGESGLEGRSFDRVRNSIGIATAQKEGSINYNLEKDYASMYAEALGNTISMQNRVKAREAQLPSRTQQGLGMLGHAVSGATTLMNVMGSSSKKSK